MTPLTLSFMNIHATMNSYIDKLSRLYVEQRNFLSDSQV